MGGGRLKFRPVEFPASSGSLIYRPDEYSFDFAPRLPGGRSILMNDLQLEVSEQGLIVYVWGYCPYQTWVPTRAMPDRIERAALAVSGIDQIPPGASTRLWDERMPMLWNAGAGWFFVGESVQSTAKPHLEFADGCVAVLDGEELVGLWLHPQQGTSGLPIPARLG